jgi:hypothetical protein
MIKVIAVLIILTLASAACAFEVSSSNPSPGEKVTITGTANPGKEVEFRTSFQMSLPVASGRYEYESSSVEVPQKPNTFAVTATGVKDLNVGVKIGIWISKRFTATNGVASISQSNVPPGRYDLKVFGEALDGGSSINLDVVAGTAVKADSAGKYSLSIDTSGIAAGAYKIEGAGETKIIQIGEGKEEFQSDANPASASSSAPASHASSGEESQSSSTQISSDGVATNSKVISWYAGQIGLDSKNPEQYAVAEKRLGYRLTGGYWKVIARGDPLTEKAGNCEEEYCLVRGADACTYCRAEEMSALSGQDKAKANITGINASKESPANSAHIEPKQKASVESNESVSKVSAREEKGFIDWLRDILLGILRLNKGG